VSDPIRLRGINHLALVCRDMATTVEWYERVLGCRLVKTIELPGGLGQHFFLDIGGGNHLAFFWFPDAPPASPGISSPVGRPDTAEMLSAVGSMNHVAFNVGADEIESYRDRLIDNGVECSEIWNHDDSEWGLAPGPDSPGVFVRSVYFTDPDGVLLELAAWTRPLGPGDVRHEPARAIDARIPAG
jgi:catechol 2,3-dioxygenase-like lactoylglutathione lyase family enzyme